MRSHKPDASAGRAGRSRLAVQVRLGLAVVAMVLVSGCPPEIKGPEQHPPGGSSDGSAATDSSAAAPATTSPDDDLNPLLAQVLPDEAAGLSPDDLRAAILRNLEDREDVESVAQDEDGLLAVRLDSGERHLFHIAGASPGKSDTAQRSQDREQEDPVTLTDLYNDGSIPYFGSGFPDQPLVLCDEEPYRCVLPDDATALVVTDYEGRLSTVLERENDTSVFVAEMLRERGYSVTREPLTLDNLRELLLHGVSYVDALTGLTDFDPADLEERVLWIRTTTRVPADVENSPYAEGLLLGHLLIFHDIHVESSEDLRLESVFCATESYLQREMLPAAGPYNVVILNGRGFLPDGSSPIAGALMENGDGTQFFAWDDTPGVQERNRTGASLIQFCTGSHRQFPANSGSLVPLPQQRRFNVSLLKAYEMLHARGLNRADGATLHWRSGADPHTIVTLAPAIESVAYVQLRPKPPYHENDWERFIDISGEFPDDCRVTSATRSQAATLQEPPNGFYCSARTARVDAALAGPDSGALTLEALDRSSVPAPVLSWTASVDVTNGRANLADYEFHFTGIRLTGIVTSGNNFDHYLGPNNPEPVLAYTESREEAQIRGSVSLAVTGIEENPCDCEESIELRADVDAPMAEVWHSDRLQMQMVRNETACRVTTFPFYYTTCEPEHFEGPVGLDELLTLSPGADPLAWDAYSRFLVPWGGTVVGLGDQAELRFYFRGGDYIITGESHDGPSSWSRSPTTNATFVPMNVPSLEDIPF